MSWKRTIEQWQPAASTKGKAGSKTMRALNRRWSRRQRQPRRGRR